MTAEAVAEAHQRDRQVQHQRGVKYLKYWFDEGSGKVFFLIEASSQEEAEAFHRQIHGGVGMIRIRPRRSTSIILQSCNKDVVPPSSIYSKECCKVAAEGAHHGQHDLHTA